jgi:DNA adenine methylase
MALREKNLMPTSPIYLDVDEPQGVVRPRPKRIIAFGYFGGKFSHLDWLLPLLPKCWHYVEPFGGSASVLLNRDPSPIETYNDMEGDVVNFFRVLRDNGDELIRKLELTPYSREEFYYACYEKAQDAVERARRFFIRILQGPNNQNEKLRLGEWMRSVSTSSNGMSARCSKWLSSIDRLPLVRDRLMRVQIENRPAIDVIERCDSSETLFYCDPPYPMESRPGGVAYCFEMDDRDHRELAEVLHSVKGKVAISGYRCPLMDELYKDWLRHDERPKIPASSANKSKTPRQECLWTNYEPPQLSLFDFSR